MNTRPKVSLDERLAAARTAVNVALSDTAILTLLTASGFTQAKLTAGQTLVNNADALFNKQKVEYGERLASTVALNEAHAAADAVYMRALKVAKMVFKEDDAARRALMLNGRRKQTLSGWQEQTNAFYNNLLLNPTWVAEMAAYGYPQTKLQAERTQVQAIQPLKEAQLRETGEAEEATKTRDAAFEAMDDFMSDFKTIAEVALADHPQWLESLGFGAIP